MARPLAREDESSIEDAITPRFDRKVREVYCSCPNVNVFQGKSARTGESEAVGSWSDKRQCICRITSDVGNREVTQTFRVPRVKIQEEVDEDLRRRSLEYYEGHHMDMETDSGSMYFGLRQKGLSDAEAKYAIFGPRR